MQENSTASQRFAAGADPTAPDSLSNPKRSLWFWLMLLVLVVGIASYLVNFATQKKASELQSSLSNRLEILANGRTEVISTWLSGLAQQGDRVVQSDLFRLYASEVELIEEDLSVLLTASLTPNTPGISKETRQLAAQLPMMKTLLQEFTRYSGFLSGRIVNRSGQSFIATDANTSPLGKDESVLVRQTILESRPQFSPAVRTGTGLVMQIYLPICPLTADKKSAQVVAVLQLTKVVSSKINELLSASTLVAKGERIRLVQNSPNGQEELAPWIPGELTTINPALPLKEQEQLPFAERIDLSGQKKVFSLGIKVPELNWWIIQEAESSAAMAPLTDYRRIAISIATLTGLLLSISLGAFWWRLVGVNNRKQADEFRKLARRIEEQRQFLNGINNNLTEYIGFKDNRGLYQYVNPAFAEAIGRTPEETIGLDDVALFGYDTASRLEDSDQLVIEKHQPLSLNERIFLQSKLHHLHISKVPLLDPEGKLEGIISVFRDVTELVETQQRSERTIRQTIEALVKTIEQNDPYLAGHSRLMSAFSGSLAKSLNADEQTQATVRTAAYLSQIGKMFIDKELLNKPGKLSTKEKTAMEKHVEHAANILREIEFELPIFDSIYQMNELLDGSGYPQKIKNDEICLPAKIMAITNSFCAMVKPRSWRSGMTVEQALDNLQQAEHQYDQTIVAALRKLAISHEGEKILDK